MPPDGVGHLCRECAQSITGGLAVRSSNLSVNHSHWIRHPY